MRSSLDEWARVFQALPRIDALFVPGGDPGHTHPAHMFPLLEQQTANLRRHHPKAQMWMAPQGFSQEWMDEFYRLVRAEPAWLTGVIFGPQVRDRLRRSAVEVHPLLSKRLPIAPQEFDVPHEATRGGTLTLTWTNTPGLGRFGKGNQIAEVWLRRHAGVTARDESR